MRRKGQKGAITVFLSIILLAMIILAGVIVDVARINTAKPQIRRAVETSVRSALAGYNKFLKEEYGLFALNDNNEGNIEEVIEEYLSKNLMIDKEYLDEKKIGDYLDLYDYEIESIEVQPIFNLTENPVTRQQILEYMKYRAPKEFAKEFIDKLKTMKKAGSTSKAYEKKIGFEKELTNIEKIQREIYKNIYGEYETQIMWLYRRGKIDYYVRKLTEKEFNNTINRYIEEVFEYKGLKKELEDIKKEIRRKKSKEEKKELEDRKRKIEEKIDESDADIKEQYEEIIEEIAEYEKANKKAEELVGKLTQRSDKVREDLDEYKDYLRRNQEEIMTDAFNNLNHEVKEYDNQIFYAKNGSKGNQLNEIKIKLNENIKILKGTNGSSIMSLIKEIDPTTAKGIEKRELNSLKSVIINRIRDYNDNIEYNYILKERNNQYKQYDNRKVIGENANKKVKINGNENRQSGVIIGEKEHSILPSNIMIQANKEKIENGIGFLWMKNADKEIKDIEFHEQERFGFSELALSNLGEITKKANFESIMDEIYINEYIIGTFKNYVSEADKEFTLRHIEKSNQDSYFRGSEVEYILNGSKSEKINQTLMDSKILLARFSLNSIHAFTCKEKNDIATSTAAAVAGWYTGGTGIPIIRTLILLGWSMGESIYDLEELKSGREVVLYKTEKDWTTDLKGNGEKSSDSKGNEEKDQNSSSKEKDLMNTSYQDYLRFFLLVQDKDKTMKRVHDLIQLNIQKSTGNSDLKLQDFNTYIRVKAVVSIKYLFITQSFMPEGLRTENNRHRFYVEIYQGY